MDEQQGRHPLFEKAFVLPWQYLGLSIGVFESVAVPMNQGKLSAVNIPDST